MSAPLPHCLCPSFIAHSLPKFLQTLPPHKPTHIHPYFHFPQISSYSDSDSYSWSLSENEENMASNLLYSPINPSTASYSRTHFFLSKPRCFPADSSRFRRLTVVAEASSAIPEEKKLRILVAGGGIGGLVFALAAKRKGFEVVVFEKDLSAVKGEGQYRGPIQLQSNALATLEAIDMDVAEQVMSAGCITGDRINGLVDGISGGWYVKFDTFTPAVEQGLPVTRVISRMTLQQILARAVGQDIIINESNVVGFEDIGPKVMVQLQNGQCHDGDVLVGADGIRSKVRDKLFGPSEAVYSGYTCYTGIADFVPADIDSVGYRVFLGHKQYFVSSDVGQGKMQWYAFHNESPGGVDVPKDLLLATDEDAILRRDIYDRNPTFTWGKGRVTLLGDSVHAMQPNLGQGGCMAIEDGYRLALELDRATRQSRDVVSSLRRYENARKPRVAIIHGLARMAAKMATTYRAYFGVGLGPLSFLTKYRIPHPGALGGMVMIDLVMPLMLSWVLGGNGSKLEGRTPHCRVTDKASDELRTWFADDDALERALDADWFLSPIGDLAAASEPIFLSRDDKRSCLIGSVAHSESPGVSIAILSQQVSKMHARINYEDGAFFLTDLRSEHGTWITDCKGRRHRLLPNCPTRIHRTNVIEFGSDNKTVFRVKATKSRTSSRGKKKDENEGVGHAAYMSMEVNL